MGERELARIFTVGHSTHELEKFVSLLTAHGVERLVDIRKMPGSRRMPYFSGEALSRSLPASGIEYGHMPELGGFRRPVPGSPNGGWQSGHSRGTRTTCRRGSSGRRSSA